jgi:hypothetical protein
LGVVGCKLVLVRKQQRPGLPFIHVLPAGVLDRS